MLLTKERLDNIRDGAKLLNDEPLAPVVNQLLSHIDSLKSDSIPKAEVIEIIMAEHKKFMDDPNNCEVWYRLEFSDTLLRIKDAIEGSER